MTERRRSEEALSGLRAELAHLSRVNTMGALTASIAHEINQPLAGILTNASTGQRMLSADPPNVQGALETVRRTIRDGHRASDVIKRLRALFTNQTVTTASLDLIEAVREVIELLRGEMRNKRIALRLIAADELPRVLADRVQLQQVVLNLLLNAMDAMAGVDNRPRDLQIRIERDERAGVELAVTDAGVGFDAQQGDKLFEAFFTTKREGMGIGLSVSRRIIESHGGTMWATSNAGHGATFAFSIPCEKDGATGDDAPSVTTGRTQSHATPT
jgi:signal transduction histidine kinase